MENDAFAVGGREGAAASLRGRPETSSLSVGIHAIVSYTGAVMGYEVCH